MVTTSFMHTALYHFKVEKIISSGIGSQEPSEKSSRRQKSNAIWTELKYSSEVLKKVTVSIRRVEKKTSKDAETETACCVYGKVGDLAQ